MSSLPVCVCVCLSVCLGKWQNGILLTFWKHFHPFIYFIKQVRGNSTRPYGPLKICPKRVLSTCHVDTIMSPLLFECLRWMPFPFSFVVVFLTFLGARLLRTSNPVAEICNDIFFNICVPFPFQNKGNWKCLLTSTNVSALCLAFADVSVILQALHTRALLSRSSGKMKLDIISW